ncbi:MAG TPA: AfsA-related hotdog domain-containing protein [Conexibacter sp.]|nr:AfsA-related hotdog domain-containing protein [Conexibacter sp.]
MEASAAPAVTRELRYDRTVSRELVHVRAVAEVFTTDAVQVGPDEFLVAVQLPRVHTLWSDHRFSHHDPLISMELGRQAVFQIIHQDYEIPVSWHFILRDVEFRVQELAAFDDDRRSPPEGVCRGRLLDRVDGDGFVNLRFEGDLSIAGVPAMAMTGAITGMRKDAYELLRGQTRGRKPLAQAPPPPRTATADPALVGRTVARNVVLADPRAPAADDGSFRYALVVDEAHPAFYDHPHDHVTGSLILELYRQAAIATAHRSGALPSPVAVVTRCALEFVDFAEPEALVECAAAVTSVDADGSVAVTVRLLQLGAALGGAQLTLVPAQDATAGAG